GRPGGPFDFGRAGRLPVRRGRARHHRRPVRPARYPARRLVDHQHLYAADRFAGGLLRLLLRASPADRSWARRVAAARHDLHQRAGAAPRRQHLRAVGRRARLGARRHRGRTGRRIRAPRFRLKANYRGTTLAIWSSAFLSLFCIFGLTGWIPTVMMQRGETFSASFGFGAMMQIMSFLGGLVLGHLIDRLGRSRGLIASWWAIGGLAVLMLAAFNTHLVNVTAVALAGFC